MPGPKKDPRTMCYHRVHVWKATQAYFNFRIEKITRSVMIFSSTYSHSRDNDSFFINHILIEIRKDLSFIREISILGSCRCVLRLKLYFQNKLSSSKYLQRKLVEVRQIYRLEILKFFLEKN